VEGVDDGDELGSIDDEGGSGEEGDDDYEDEMSDEDDEYEDGRGSLSGERVEDSDAGDEEDQVCP